jgi:hypothetical protein
MEMLNSIVVNKPADEIWELLGNDFVDVAKWMAAIPRSVEKTEGTPLPGAPAVGRLSYMIQKFNGAYQDEVITKYDDATRSLSIYATIEGFPSFAPVRGYSSDVSVTPIDENSSTVRWDSVADMRILGYLTYRAMKKTMNAGFIRNLEEIKHFVETGQPHPRKIDKIKTEALALKAKSA